MTKRVNITVSDSVYDVLKGMSEDYGMPLSSLGSMAIMSWLEQKQAMVAMGNVQELVEKLNVMQKELALVKKGVKWWTIM